jgi:SAM-dependent methyltransferase
MAKLTKQQLRDHQEALKILEIDRDLIYDERLFVIQNWRPTSGDVTANDAFFTPWSMAEMLALDTYDQGHILDLCAGTGRLSLAMYFRSLTWPGHLKITAVEKNPDFIKVGRKVLPEVQWIEGDIFDLALWNRIGKFDGVVSNPPFSSTTAKVDWLKYKGPLSLMAIEVAMRVSHWGGATFILPAAQCPFEWRNGHYKEKEGALIPEPFRKFQERWPQIEWRISNFDPAEEEDFDDTKVKTQIVHLEWDFRHRKIAVPPLEIKQEIEICQIPVT